MEIFRLPMDLSEPECVRQGKFACVPYINMFQGLKKFYKVCFIIIIIIIIIVIIIIIINIINIIINNNNNNNIILLLLLLLNQYLPSF